MREVCEFSTHRCGSGVGLDSAGLDLPHAGVEWRTMLIFHCQDDRRVVISLLTEQAPGLFTTLHETDPDVRLLWISPVLHGYARDLFEARTHRIIRSCERQGIPILGRAPTPTQQTVNRALSTAWALVERGATRLNSGRILCKARCGPHMSLVFVAILTLERQH
ncbi:hypothetical protein [Streptomyces puniciscabiei]|uniref:hypothetical protein n=1 Tax=Streptomyces puniciscabiei TaxID=164348 RepID=UPI0037A8528C